MSTRKCILIGAGMDCGKRRRGCVMGPDAYRTAGLAETLGELGWHTEDRGNVDGPVWVPDAPAGSAPGTARGVEAGARFEAGEGSVPPSAGPQARARARQAGSRFRGRTGPILARPAGVGTGKLRSRVAAGASATMKNADPVGRSGERPPRPSGLSPASG